MRTTHLPKTSYMKKIIIIGLITASTSGLWAQEHEQGKQQKDKNKTEMQQGDTNHSKKAKKSTTKKTAKTRKNDDANRRMDHYPSTKDNSKGTPAEQKQMDETINNHR